MFHSNFPPDVQEVPVCFLEILISRNFPVLSRNSPCPLSGNFSPVFLGFSLCFWRTLPSWPKFCSLYVFSPSFVRIYFACFRKISLCFLGIPLCLVWIFSLLSVCFLVYFLGFFFPLLSKTFCVFCRNFPYFWGTTLLFFFFFPGFYHMLSWN